VKKAEHRHVARRIQIGEERCDTKLPDIGELGFANMMVAEMQTPAMPRLSSKVVY